MAWEKNTFLRILSLESSRTVKKIKLRINMHASSVSKWLVVNINFINNSEISDSAAVIGATTNKIVFVGGILNHSKCITVRL